MFRNADSTSAKTEIGISPVETATSRILAGNQALWVKVLWAVIVIVSVGLYVIAIPQPYQQLSTVAPDPNQRGVHQLAPDEAQLLDQAGIPITTYALYVTAIDVITSAAFFLIGFLMFARKPNNSLIVFASLTLIMTGATSSGLFTVSLISPLPLVAWGSAGLLFIATICEFILLIVFPDGRFVPSWMRWVCVALVVALTISFAIDHTKSTIGSAASLAPILLTIAWLLAGIYAQWYRYRKLSSPAQRQQTKWVILCATIFVSGQVIQTILRTAIPQIGQPGPLHLLFNVAVQMPILNGLFEALVPLALAVALFRYHLWDVDLYINRGLVIGGLTLLLGALFFGGVALFQALSGGQSPLALGASAVVVGIAFQPARRNLEHFVDRRLYGLRVDFRRPQPKVEPAALPAPLAPVETRQFGPYQLTQLLGRGGMGEVYKGYHSSLNREVAIKVLPATLNTDATARKRFEAEAQIVAGLHHPNIIQVFDFGETEGMYYMVMEYVDGRDLAQYMRQNAPLPLDTVRSIFQEVADALDYANQAGYIHRDVKPSNVMLQPTTNTSTGKPFRAILMDFGIAKIINSDSSLTGSGVVVGTFSYMAPEQIMADRQIDQRADIYALGVMLYQMITGKLPFESDNPGTIIFSHLNRPAPDPRDSRPELPESISRAVLRSMAKDPADRFPSAGAFAAALAG